MKLYRHDRSTSWIIIIARSKDAVRTKIKKESMHVKNKIGNKDCKTCRSK